MKGPEVTVVKEMTFDSAHYLPEYDGLCCNMHGHTYKLQVGIKGRVNTKTGMVCDFSIVKKIMKQLVEKMDHKCLNKIEDAGFPNTNPTAELMVIWIALKMMELLPDGKEDKIFIDFVRLWETPTSFAEIYV